MWNNMLKNSKFITFVNELESILSDIKGKPVLLDTDDFNFALRLSQSNIPLFIIRRAILKQVDQWRMSNAFSLRTPPSKLRFFRKSIFIEFHSYRNLH